MLILGLDPGSRHTGFGLIRKQGESLQAVDYGRLSFSTSMPLPQRLAGLSAALVDLLERWQPEAAVLESPFHGVNPRSLVVLAQARGVLLAALGARQIEVREYSPAEIKSAVTGNGRADKRQVAKMVALTLAQEIDDASPDATDALAAALCYAQRWRMDRLERLTLARK